jgi:hypothetical protein
MAIEAAFRDLTIGLLALRESLVDLRTTVVEDKPLQGDVVLVEVFGDAADDMIGWMDEALIAADEAQQAVTAHVDINRARRALAICHERQQRVARQFSFDLVGYDRIAELTRFGYTRGGEWRGWAQSVRTALEACREPIYEVSQALFRCWQEIAERAGMTSLSVCASGIG